MVNSKLKSIAIVFFVITLSITTACKAQSLRVKLLNITGHDIDSLIALKKYIGSIKKNNITDIIKYDRLVFDSNRELLEWYKVSGTIKNLKPDTNFKPMLPHCGTGNYSETSGDFLFYIRIRISPTDSTYSLYLSRE